MPPKQKFPEGTRPAPAEKTTNAPLSGKDGLAKLSESTSTVEGPKIKDILNTPEGKEKFKVKKIVIAGPPRSGKSCFREGAKQAIKNLPNAPYPLFITACPDGEGAWFQETMNKDPELAAKLKADYKSKFTPEFVKRVADSVSNLKLELNFIDIGGIITPENAQICKDANAALLLCGETSVEAGLPAEWKTFFSQLNIPVIAELYSDYYGKDDYVEGTGEDGVFRASVHHLERGENLGDREAIQNFARFVVNFEKIVNLYEKESKYTFGLLDPRPIDAAKTANKQIFANAKNGAIGIEMTLPQYLDQCTLGNIDPQHTDGDITKAAIDVVLDMPLPTEEVAMVTVRPDLDSLGSMALLSLRQKGLEVTDAVRERAKKISISDTFANGEWKPSALPDRNNIWAGVNDKDLSAIAALVMDFKVPVNQRIKVLEKWFETGEEPVEYRERVKKDRMSIVDALEKGDIKHSVVGNGEIAVVESRSGAGTAIGYSLAPTVVVTNPQFSFQGAEPIVKHTICQYKLGYVDLVAVLKELNEIEKGWGGSPTIIGSPQGVSSTIPQEKIVEIVSKHLLKT
ncbi:hypothetical protein A3I46_02625 [Candidatus Kaiserbacteria bacterium RIFCSPLOWO2_02_FULL_54_13]|uniref:Uncharacterized protein n=1 Tax=Candidatus Kaiserbacteria bacterium RIFCSPHIGHO2_02_FULL_54_22 TaxID=1798495 RepID=A0A1F6DM18_9BACT|nr:MAG: hypothetical protein UY91_C0027G0009 [Parcubacteria group bacterium GW2011_GWB1_55_9]OGG62330.1 MAG: hypothetical protein A3C19_03460 [Candidatus Kaiserbacteria bacterium RIFCSPHIGHO2_02_FULL_54_22]OGG68838.1 MAG: hypothetical protein A3E99_02870 [Candidatus Kaiserbacteria bacterium RIFCSPHIGHO2_12_FULL_54_16]OGG83843.1 MAG: hypothetical protein A3I46_02625 [Candidatus Kaiserbacteria bacterium RIFCSPLOWO2_02_FULL_54_13]OGG90148.1 MAG: hypothetical protein A3G12_03170 [Candidatus Kaiserb